MRTTYEPGCFMTVRVDDENQGRNTGNNSDQFELVLETEQYMTVRIPVNARQPHPGDEILDSLSFETVAYQVDKMAITIVGPLEWREFLESMRAISKE